MVEPNLIDLTQLQLSAGPPMYPAANHRKKTLVPTGTSALFHLALLGGLFLVSNAPALPPAKEAIPIEVVMETPKAQPQVPPNKTLQPKPLPKPNELIKPLIAAQPVAPQQTLILLPKITSKPLGIEEKPAILKPDPIAPPKAKRKIQAKQPKRVVHLPRKLPHAAPISAPSPPPKAVNREKIIAYVQQVGARIAAMKRYPNSARERSAHGTAVVSFTIDASGQPQNITIARSSGDPTLDEEARATVLRAAPFAPPPPGASRELSIALGFKLRG